MARNLEQIVIEQLGIMVFQLTKLTAQIELLNDENTALKKAKEEETSGDQ